MKEDYDSQEKDVEAPKPSPILERVVQQVISSNRERNKRISEFDNDLLARAVQDAGRWAFGTVFVEVWVLNRERTHLERPPGGWWMDPVYHLCGGKCDLCALTDPSNAHYLPPIPLPSGVGLPGVLWAESNRGNAADVIARKMSARFADLPGMSARAAQSFRTNRSADDDGEADFLSPMIHWREVKPLVADPDQPYNERLQHLARIGLGWAAGVPFHMGQEEGIVIYMARDTIDLSKLTSRENESYLVNATLLIGAAYALRGPRRKAIQARHREKDEVLRRIKNKLLILASIGAFKIKEHIADSSSRLDAPSDLGVGFQDQEDVSTWDGWKRLSTATTMTFEKAFTRVSLAVRKTLGANIKPPPAFNSEQAMFTFLGSFVTLVCLTTTSQALSEAYGASRAIVLGPFGALMTLQFGLTAAPASQPRNAMLGQTMALIIGQAFGQISGMDRWLRLSLATSISIGLMAKFGITHPPAGAAALLFASGALSWAQVGINLMANVVAIVCASFINNLNDKRQYPTFWGVPTILVEAFRGPLRCLLPTDSVKESSTQK